MTTRKMRPGEVNGKDYYFVSKEEFEKEIESGGMLEYAKYVDNYYGTPLKYVNEMLDAGKDVFWKLKSTVQCRFAKSSGRIVHLFNAA